MELGLICSACRTAHEISAQMCANCGQALFSGEPLLSQVSAEDLHQEDRVNSPKLLNKTLFFSALQEDYYYPRLVVLRGPQDGVTYALQNNTVLIGKNSADIALQDEFTSEQHARLYRENDQFMIEDLSSKNGVFLRIREPTSIQHGDRWLVGQQLFELDDGGFSPRSPNAQGTYFCGSVIPQTTFCVIQRLSGGRAGYITYAREGSVTFGRSGNLLNFPRDPFLSTAHAKLEAVPGSLGAVLTDLQSRNGSYVQIRHSHPLHHGDLLWIGRNLLRFET